MLVRSIIWIYGVFWGLYLLTQAGSVAVTVV